MVRSLVIGGGWRSLGTVGVGDGSNTMSNVTIKLDAGESAVVGYGLLLSRGTIDKTLDRLLRDGLFR